MPRVLLVSYSDLTGRRFDGYDLMQRGAPGWEFGMAVVSKESEDPGVFELFPERVPAGTRLLRRADRALALDGMLGTGLTRLAGSAAFDRADLVHLHLLHIGPSVGIRGLPLLARLKPLVWTVHDMWPLTGMCVHPFECSAWRTGCGRLCPHPRGGSPLRRITPALLWRIKRRLLARSRPTLVAASRWMRERIAASPILGGLPCEVIPFGVDGEVFSPRGRAAARAAMGISGREPVLCCRGVPVARDAFKGSALLVEALGMLEPPPGTRLVVIGETADFAGLSDRYVIHGTGWIGDPAGLAAVLSASDVLLMPSLQESFGLTAVEAMACGAVPAVLPGTALPETTGAPSAGLVAADRTPEAFASAVGALLSSPGELAARSAACIGLASSRYSFAATLDAHLALYSRLIEGRGGL